MVRAGVVTHPSEWPHSGYREIQNPPRRYGIIDLRQLSALCGFSEVADFQRAHGDWVDEALKREMVMKEGRWSEAIAVGIERIAPNFVVAHPRVPSRASLRAQNGRLAANFAVEAIGKRLVKAEEFPAPTSDLLKRTEWRDC